MLLFRQKKLIYGKKSAESMFFRIFCANVCGRCIISYAIGVLYLTKTAFFVDLGVKEIFISVVSDNKLNLCKRK